MIPRRIAALALLLALVVAACGSDDKGSADKKDTSSAQGGGSPTAAAVACPADATELDDGLCYVDTKVGTGPEVVKGDVLNMDYTGKLADGTVFDASERHGQPLQFKLGVGAVIQGWDEGIVGMKVGGERTLTIPPELGYGEAGYPPVIPPNATLVFDVKVVSIEPQGKSGK
jgi:FKBP-type peptidyl-prolyl cis-trans isomerase